MTKNSSTATPPAAAVAKDAHWAAKRDKLRSRVRPTATMTICDDQAARQALDSARQDVLRAQISGDAPKTATAEAALADAQAAFDDAAIVLTFQALRRTDFEDLKAGHPPTEAQADEGQIVNVETFGPALISACSLDGLTVEDATSFLTEWSAGEAAQLFNTSWDLQEAIRADLGKG